MSRAFLLLLLACPSMAAKKKAGDLRPAERQQPAGYSLFARVAKEGKKIPGPAADEGLPTDRSYFNVRAVTVSLDGQYCMVNFGRGGVPPYGDNGRMPHSLLDRGCTGTLATTEADWDGAAEPLTQERLDRWYSGLYNWYFRDLKGKVK